MPAVRTNWERHWAPSGVFRPVAIGSIVACLSLLTLIITSAGLTPVVLPVIILAGAALFTWFRPVAGMQALVIGGSLHQTLMLLVFFASGSFTLVKAAQSWKDLLVLVLLVKVIDLAFRRGRAPRLHLLDLGVLTFIGIGCFYLGYPSPLEDVDVLTTIFGLRADVFFLLAYFVGRGLPLTSREVRALVLALTAVATLIAVVAFAQVAAPGAANDVFNLLGYQGYLSFQLVDGSTSFAVRENELLGGLRIPRASSFLLSDLALAFHTLLTAPIALALLFRTRRVWHSLVLDAVAVATIATGVLTLTRSAILAMGPALAVVALRGRAVLVGLIVALQVGAGALVVARAFELTPKMLEYLFSPNEASAQAHFAAFDVSLNVLRKEPFGQGLGTGGQVAQRFASHQGITNESWYLQIATELGIVPAVLFLLLLVGFGIVAWRQSGQVRDPWLKALCLGMLGATIGFGIVGLTLHVWEALTTSIIFWLFAGIVVRVRDIEAGGGTPPGGGHDASGRLA